MDVNKYIFKLVKNDDNHNIMRFLRESTSFKYDKLNIYLLCIYVFIFYVLSIYLFV